MEEEKGNALPPRQAHPETTASIGSTATSAVPKATNEDSSSAVAFSTSSAISALRTAGANLQSLAGGQKKKWRRRARKNYHFTYDSVDNA
jgi:hypothetical protein